MESPQIKSDTDQVLGHKVAARSQLRPGERQRPPRFPPRYHERRALADTSLHCFRGFPR